MSIEVVANTQFDWHFACKVIANTPYDQEKTERPQVNDRQPSHLTVVLSKVSVSWCSYGPGPKTIQGLAIPYDKAYETARAKII